MAALLLIVDPLVSGAPWGMHPDPGFWFVLVFPLLPWLGLAGLMAWLGHGAASRLTAILLTLTSLAAGIIPSFFFTVLLDDVFPEAGPMGFSQDLALAAGALALPLSLVVLARRLMRRRTAEPEELRAPRTQRTAGRN